LEQEAKQVEGPEGGDGVDATDREWVLKQLRRVLDIALDRVTHPKTPPSDRIKWSRVVISAGQACNSLLRDAEIDELKREIQELGELAEERLSDEQDSDQKPDTTTQEED
jgi:hypothetical protein